MDWEQAPVELRYGRKAKIRVQVKVLALHAMHLSLSIDTQEHSHLEYRTVAMTA